MLFEYAIEPAAICNFERVRFFLGSMGVPHARLIARYPKKWERMVLESLPRDCGEVERKRIEEGLLVLRPACIGAMRQYVYETPWVSNATNEHKKLPFQAVIVNQGGVPCPGVLEYDSLGPAAPLWNVHPTRSVSRTAEAMAEAIAPLLRIAQDVAIVDSYFKPDVKKYQEMVQRFWKAAMDGRGGTILTRFVLHTCVQRGWDRIDPEAFVDSCSRHLPEFVPPSKRMKVIIWEERDAGEEFHNRYCLTDRGGVFMGKGIDRGQAGQTDDWSILSNDHSQMRRKQFPDLNPDEPDDGTTTFRQVRQVTIVGVLDPEAARA
jgi:hypothetical protein